MVFPFWPDKAPNSECGGGEACKPRTAGWPAVHAGSGGFVLLHNVLGQYGQNEGTAGWAPSQSPACFRERNGGRTRCCGGRVCGVARSFLEHPSGTEVKIGPRMCPRRIRCDLEASVHCEPGPHCGTHLLPASLQGIAQTSVGEALLGSILRTTLSVPPQPYQLALRSANGQAGMVQSWYVLICAM